MQTTVSTHTIYIIDYVLNLNALNLALQKFIESSTAAIFPTVSPTFIDFLTVKQLFA